MSKDKKSNRRRNYFIKKGFQIRFILKFCSLVLIGVIMYLLLPPIKANYKEYRLSYSSYYYLY